MSSTEIPNLQWPSRAWPIISGSIIFIIGWCFMAFKIKWVPVGRTVGTLLGAVAMVVCKVLSSSQAYQAINLETLFLLFGGMVMTGQLEQEGFFVHVVDFLAWRCKTRFGLLVRVCIVTALLAALVTNDTACVFLTPIVISLCLKYKLPPLAFLVGLGTSANIGSACTPVGNPQNMIIASLSGIKYASFIIYIGPVVILAMIVNILFLYIYYRSTLHGALTIHPHSELQGGGEDNNNNNEGGEQEAENKNEEMNPKKEHNVADMDNTHPHQDIDQDPTNLELDTTTKLPIGPRSDDEEEKSPKEDRKNQNNNIKNNENKKKVTSNNVVVESSSDWRVKWRRNRKLYLFSGVLVGTVIAFICGAPLGWAATAGGTIMLLLDMKDPDECFRKVDWSLLVFFSALFILVQGFQYTGLPLAVWDKVGRAIDLKTVPSLLSYTSIILVGSNTVSNVPLTLIMAPHLPHLPTPFAAWVLLAYISTVAGNLTLVGSVALLIVCERSKAAYSLSFFEFLKFGVPTTLFITYLGSLLLYAMLPSR